MDQSWIEHESITPTPTSLSPAGWSYWYGILYYTALCCDGLKVTRRQKGTKNRMRRPPNRSYPRSVPRPPWGIISISILHPAGRSRRPLCAARKAHTKTFACAGQRYKSPAAGGHNSTICHLSWEQRSRLRCRLKWTNKFGASHKNAEPTNEKQQYKNTPRERMRPRPTISKHNITSKTIKNTK